MNRKVIFCTIRRAWLEAWEEVLGPILFLTLCVAILTGVVLGAKWLCIYFFGDDTSALILLVSIAILVLGVICGATVSGIQRIIEIKRQCERDCSRLDR